jgi:hypothetical protein
MGNTGNCQTKKKRKFDTVVQSPLLISNLHMKNTKQQAKINYKILAVFKINKLLALMMVLHWETSLLTKLQSQK